jgi:hypothetical protein
MIHDRWEQMLYPLQELSMKYALLLCVPFLLCAAISSASEPNALRNRILRDTTIQGYPCARGDAWFYPDGSLNQCTLSRSAALGDLPVPRGSVVEFWPNGAAHYLMLQRPAPLAGYKIRGGTRLGLSRGRDYFLLQHWRTSFALSGLQRERPGRSVPGWLVEHLHGSRRRRKPRRVLPRRASSNPANSAATTPAFARPALHPAPSDPRIGRQISPRPVEAAPTVRVS